MRIPIIVAVGIGANSNTQDTIDLNESDLTVIRLLNKRRVDGGLLPLAVDEEMAAAAAARVGEVEEFYQEKRPNWSTVDTLLDEMGITYDIWGQCYVDSYTDAAAVASAWLGAQSSASEIMNPDYTRGGVAHGADSSVWAALLTGTCQVDSISIAQGRNGGTYDLGTEIESFEEMLVLDCREHGGSYVPLIDEMVEGYDKNTVGVQTLTVKYGDKAVSFDVTIEGEDEIEEPENIQEPEDIVYQGFDDVVGTEWYAKYIKFVVEKGLFEGTSSTTFDPESTMTRAMFVTVLGRLSERWGVEIVGDKPDFNDLEEEKGEWYYKYVCWAWSADLVNGYSLTAFGPNDPITREQMAALFVRYADYVQISLETGTPNFKDAGDISRWAVEDVGKANASGLLVGYDDGTFRPQRTATRAEVATVFQRFMALY